VGFLPPTYSLDRKLPDYLNSSGKLTWVDLITDTNAIGQDEKVEQDEATQILHAALKQLPGRQAKILKLRFGIERKQEYTLRQIGRMYHLSKERIRQIESHDHLSKERIRQIESHALKNLESLLVI